jgi:peptidoglycan hydrolase CwlO-like protein
LIDGDTVTFGTPVPVEMVYQDKEMADIDVNALKEELKKDLSATYDGKIKEMSEKITALETEKAELASKIKEMAEAEAEMKTRESASAVRDLAAPPGYRVTIDSNGEVYAVEG